MNSFNLAVCFAPNIIYTKINKLNDLYINEERLVVQLLIENSSLIGKVTDSVYERSLMLSSLCCSTIMMTSNNSVTGAINNGTGVSNLSNPSVHVDRSNVDSSVNVMACNSGTGSVTSGFGSSGVANSEMMFLYDNDLQENSSFAHMAQSAGSTSLSSYCSNKKEKKKRRSSSLKELMNTIQNSISKFRRRSASEKNDKTTCSIVTCTSMSAATSSSNNNVNIPSGNYIFMNLDDKLTNGNSIASGSLNNNGSKQSQQQQQLLTPLCVNMYATPRINKRNAEESLQSTTKK
jgi:hypothetical protein